MIKRLKKYLDTKLILLLSLIYFLIVLVNLVKNLYLKSNGYRFESVSWSELIWIVHGEDYLAVVIYIIFTTALTKYMSEKKFSLFVVVPVHCFLGFALGPFIYFATTMMAIFLGHHTFAELWDFYFIVKFVAVVDLNLIVYCTIIITSYIYYYFNQVIASQQRRSDLEKQLNNTRLSVLRSQLHPHFLFNTLNSIHSLVAIDKERSKKLLGDITDLLEEITETGNESLITIDREIDLLQKYLRIIDTRFSDDLTVNLKIEPGLGKEMIPQMLIQPLVENTIKHGYSNTRVKLKLNINLFRFRDSIRIELENNGQLLPQNFDYRTAPGTGIRNLLERLKTLYRETYYFDILNENNHVKTRINIPLKLSR